MTRFAMWALTIALALAAMMAAWNQWLWVMRTLLCGGLLSMAALLYGEIRKGAR